MRMRGILKDQVDCALLSPESMDKLHGKYFIQKKVHSEIIEVVAIREGLI